jgi:hypothetical protein
MAGNVLINNGLEGHGLEDSSLNVFEKIKKGFASLIPKFAKNF